MKKIGFTLLLLIITGLIIAQNMDKNDKIKEGDKLPYFTLADQNNKSFSTKDYIGKQSMVIYFYPKDDTPGCTKEACKFRDEFEDFKNLNALVIGISSDSVESHKKFEEKYNLPFILLADVNNEIRKLFGVPKSLLFMPGRVTYIVNKEGVVTYVFNSQFGAEKHIDIAKKKLQEIEIKS